MTDWKLHGIRGKLQKILNNENGKSNADKKYQNYIGESISALDKAIKIYETSADAAQNLWGDGSDY
ncbi:hypothetical protein LCGC14_1004370 [marine sediment metagenome]|uniref:Uncharacterized protein n=1 Tax=marine sediment metagenome TaxID=412755 RepID=A0A0F9N6Q3_9ZZZZ